MNNKSDAKRPRRLRRIVIDESVPFHDERTRFLEHMLNGGWSKHTVRMYELRLAEFASLVDIMTPGGVTGAQIELAADDWQKTPSVYCGLKSRSGCQRVFFIRAASRWLQFLGRLREREPAPYSSVISAFESYLGNERGLSPLSIATMTKRVRPFLMWLDDLSRNLAEVTISDVEAYLASERPRKWSRVTVSICVVCLRSFFRYAEKANLCARNIAVGIDAPRLYSQSTLPKGPSWAQVRRLIASIGTSNHADIRDRAIIILFAVYGFRLGEVQALRLEDIDWQRERIIVKRRKQYCVQLYPLVREVGDAILLYLQKVRPKTTRRELFISQTVPFEPLTTGAITSVVERRLRSLGEKLPHYGPHSLRHACATHLMAEGLSLKEIGDHLGHRDPRATQVYAKVDLKGLREVARLDLGGLI